MSNGEIIVAEGLTRRYGQSFTAVDSIDLSINQGEVFGLLGTNGAGKTSTMEVLEGLAPATSGTVRVLGYDPRKHRDRIRPHQGVMLQQGGFPTDLTVTETLQMWAATLSHSLPVAQTLAQVGLAQRANVRVKALSGGEVRRLDLACAVIGNPTLLFLDEPTTGLDPESRRNTWQLIQSLHENGATIVLTTHYLEEAEALCERFAIMHGGKIAREGTPDEVVAGYRGTISFRTDAPLPDYFQDLIVSDTGTVTLATHAIQRDLTALLNWAEQNDVQLRELQAREANLETVFLDIAKQTI